MRIALVGDVMLGRLVNQALKHSDPAYPWGDTLPILHHADLRICNLECVLSDIGSPWSATPKVFHFRSDEKNIKALQEAKMNMVSLANNHVLDYEYEAFQRMLNILDEQGIQHAGAGKDALDASKAAVYRLNRQTIGFMAFTDNEPDWASDKNTPGVNFIPTDISDKRVHNLLKDIENLRKEVDFLIVSAHWGSNWGYHPPEEHRSLGHALIDAGADLIFGHSAHVFRGIEVYKNRPIIYSAGDFIDDYAVDEIERNDESFIFVLEQEKDLSLIIYLYPTCISQFQVNIATLPRRKAILSKMEGLCHHLGSSLEYSDKGVFVKISTP
jgi:poly-gamma-glutamate capsule biosynthesis protein CapA/YwtB (metallophosphatase superfamily)